ncbi:aminopeptidase N-like [Palaemon carinicauda]|uniref:aminopeptidase N-like n=1 Tax=Palaemon carinicauda TaxID=392227 RepID=UPI0035B5BC5D
MALQIRKLLLVTFTLICFTTKSNAEHQVNDPEVEVTTVLGPMLRNEPDLLNPFSVGPKNGVSFSASSLEIGARSLNGQSARLPTALLPTHYVVRLQPFINGNLTIYGSVDITLKAAETTDRVVINMVDIITINETVAIRSLNDTKSHNVVQQTYDPKNQLYTALLSEDLAQHNTYLFHIEFQGYLNDRLVGFYRSQYTDSQGNEKLLAASQFSPTDARRAFPCFDEPGFKATFDIHLARQQNMTALSNMPLIATEPIEGEEGWVWDTFNTTLRMSTYLVGFLISDFGSVTSDKLNHTLFKVWARKEALDQAAYARDVAPPILTFLEDYFSIKFPLPKLDMAAIPDFKFSGMENWGLITYRETALLYNSKLSSVKSKQILGNVLAHEIAHQWFGNLVTPIWWSDLWLKEGFASFMGYTGLDAAEPSWRMKEQFVTEFVHAVMKVDSLLSSHPINVEVDHPDQISEIFDFISYRKGATIIRMMQHFLTEATFRKGLTNYLNALKFDNAEQDDLWKYLTEAGHADSTLPAELTVKLIMDTWTLKEGYPVVSVSREGNSATLVQEWFRLSRKSTNASSSQEPGWWIPVSYTSQPNSNFSVTRASHWMSDDRKPLKISGLPDQSQWIIVNLQETGYFRVNYDSNTWKLLNSQLKQDHSVIHAINRAQILDDALNLARAGVLDYPTALTTSSYLSNETEYVPWSSALDSLGYLRNMFERSAGYGPLRNYLMSLLEPLYNSVGFEDSETDHHLTKHKRILAVTWACNLAHTPCITKAIDLFQKWVASNESVFSPNVQSTVLCTGIKYGGETEWNAAWKRYTQSNVGAEKSDILYALGCTKEIWILSRYLEMAFTPESGIRKQDASAVFKTVAKNEVGRDLAWNYLQDRWLQILQYFGSGSGHLAKVVKAATNTFNTPLEVKELEKFQADYEDQLGSAVRATEQVLESAKLNRDWMEDNYSIIVQWLEGMDYKSAI